jgi:methylthioribose-1-phosphate isomerase
MEEVSVRTVWWEPGAVCLLDQRRLPQERATVRCISVAEVAGAIRQMVVRGAPAIGVTAAYGMALAAHKSGATDAADLLDELAAAKRTLDAARPTACQPELGHGPDAGGGARARGRAGRGHR